jgi:hypothetical protein
MLTPSTVAGGGFQFSVPSVGGKWSWKVEADNIQGLGQTYKFVDIHSPYGPLYTTAIPIPGDVISSMANSLLQVQQQLAPLMLLISPNPAIFNTTITEGDPISEVGVVVVQNAGAFGSFMSINATPNSPWLSVSPSSATAISQGQSSQFTIQLNPGTLLAANSPYSGQVNLQDNRNPPTLVPATVNVTVLPRPTIGVSPGSIIMTFSISTSAPSGAQSLTVTNLGLPGSSLNFSVQALLQSAWLAFVPASGGPLAANQFAIVTASIIPGGVPLAVGTYADTLRVYAPNSTNSYVDTPVTLIVNP